jgi:hypothetical protein
MGVAFGETGEFGGIEAGVHAGEDREAAAGRHGQMAFVETGGVGVVGLQNFVLHLRHACFSWEFGCGKSEKIQYSIGVV